MQKKLLDTIKKQKIGLYEFAKQKVGKLTTRNLGIATNTLKYICNGGYMYKVCTKGYKGIRSYEPNPKTYDVLCKKLGLDMEVLKALIENSKEKSRQMKSLK